MFTTIGQVAPGEYNGGCVPCTAVQRTANPAGAYTFPYGGVLTRFSTRKGSSITTSPVEWIRARTFQPVNATTAHVISESAQADLDPSTPSTVQTFWDRVPAATGNVLGAKFNTGAFIAETPYVFTTGTTASDSAAATFGVPGPGVGDDAVATAFPNLRVNISARLEHDDDHDGYGDGSQDLCLGDAAHAATACSGTLFAGNLQGAYKQVGFVCGFACARIQLTSGGASTSPAADGVVVRWRMQAPKPGDYHVLILEPAGGGNYTYARVSDTVTIGADEALSTFPTRLSIKAGGYVALVPPAFAIETSFQTTPAGSTLTTVGDGPVGSSTTFPSGIAAAILYNADIEPDADHDGYGDVTQDACPASATTHGACPVSPPPPPPPPPAGHPPAAFVSFATSAKSLRVSKTRRFSYSFVATPLSPGTVGLKSTKKVKIGSKKRLMTIGAKSFTPSSAGKVKVTFKLSTKNLKALKKARKLSFAVTATLSGKTFTAKLTLKAPKKT
ncbi:MAG: hypothetical protein QOG15_245 [Solirubrobacteraceae bacterium]|nr:hypothetical protein [Solirubrobacteraceae bacterium]